MIICSRESATSLLKDSRNLLSADDRNKDIVDYPIIPIKHGRGEGKENLTPEMRNLILEEARMSGRTAEEVAKDYGVSTSTIAALKNSATSTATYNQPVEALKETNDKIDVIVKEEAKNKLLLALEALTPDKIYAAKARDIAGIAKDMAGIMKDSGPSVQVNNTKVLVYSPRMKEEDDYDVVEARE